MYDSFLGNDFRIKNNYLKADISKIRFSHYNDEYK